VARAAAGICPPDQGSLGQPVARIARATFRLSEASFRTLACMGEPEVGLEPTTCCLQDSCSGQLSYSGED
jgi:hypothetical protein